MASWERPKAIAIAGPTASGKSALSMLVAQRWPCEIISVDSALVYRDMNIGTAKPTQEELALVPHHLIDVLDPTQSYSAAQFVQDAQQLIEAIHARGKLALLVGGTMLYFKALIQGIDDMPIANPSIRAGIDEEAKALGWPALHAQLARIDPMTAERLSPNDSQRIQRALEVYRSSGNPLSFYHRKESRSLDRTAPNAIESIANIPLLSLEPAERSWLHQRIAQRFEQMLQMGLIEEVLRLRQRGDLHLGLPSMRCVGYRQTWEMLDGAFPLVDLLNKGIVATRQLAKRQITWQRSMRPTVFNKHVLEADNRDANTQALALIDSWLSTSRSSGLTG